MASSHTLVHMLQEKEEDDEKNMIANSNAIGNVNVNNHALVHML